MTETAESGLPGDAVVIPIRVEGRTRRGGGHPGSGRTAADALRTLLPEAEMPVIGPISDEAPTRGAVPAPRLARHVITLSDGHQVGVSVSGVGVPLVVIHGFSAEGFLYAQSLSRLVSMGFKVIALDIANHGSTQGLPAGGANFKSYTELLARTLNELGIERAFLAGHSMGGRLVTQLAAGAPECALGVILIDAIVGDEWDGLVNLGRMFPPLMGGVVVLLALDALSTPPLLKNPQQAAKLIKLFVPTLTGHVRRPWRLLGPAVSILRSRGSRWMLERLAQEEVPVVTIHGTADFPVPFETAKSTARRSRGTLVMIDGARHCWPLRDPETLPAIMADLLHGPLGEAYRDAIRHVGLDPDVASLDDVEAAMYAPGAPICELTPPLEFARVATRARRPAYRYRISPSRAADAAPVPRASAR